MTALAQTEVDGVKVLRLSGSLTQEGVELVRNDFLDEVRGTAPVVVDLSGVDMIYTPGIAMLLSAQNGLQRTGRRLVVTGACGMVDDVLHRCMLDRVLTLVTEPETAIRQARGN